MPADASRSRIDPRAGFAGPGVKACRECGVERLRGVRWRTFCSETCIHEWKVRSNPGYAREQVEKRDSGVCVLCRVDTCDQRAELCELRRHCATAVGCGALEWRKRHRSCPYGQRCEQLGISVRRRQGWPFHLWEMDHVKPVVEGGGSCGLDNLRTLCIACHVTVTRELRARIARQKREVADA